MKEIFEPIETEVGIISGRDAIFLDEINFDYLNQNITFFGELNSHLCSKTTIKDEWIKYSLTFTGVLSFQMIELDFSGIGGKSSFDLVQNSMRIEDFKKYDSARKVQSEHKHYFLRTYDDVFEVVSLGYELNLAETREMK